MTQTHSSGLGPGMETTLAVDALATGGGGVCRTDGFVVFTDRGLPGQRVRVRVDKVKKRFAEATLLEVVEPSGREVEAPCPHFGVCGGCRWQHLDYAEQLEWKRSFVAESLRRIGAGDKAGNGARAEVLPCLPSPRLFGFRNKMEYAFAQADDDGDELHLGLRRLGSHAVEDVTGCLLQSEAAARIVNRTRELCRALGVAAYDPKPRTGCWRFLIVREFERTGQRMVQLITAPGKGHARAAKAVGEALLAEGGITTLVHAERAHPAQLAFGERVVWTQGPGHIEERLEEVAYRISADAFFQTNTEAAEALYRVVRKWAVEEPRKDADGPPLLWDLYSGTGSIALFLARSLGRGARIVGMESHEAAVRDAQDNARANGLTEEAATFLAGDVRTLIREQKCAPDVVVCDPPRAGMHREVVHALLEAAPRRIVSVSCDPATHARDLGLLAARYDLRRVQPVDLFPQTPHVESVALLVRRS